MIVPLRTGDKVASTSTIRDEIIIVTEFGDVFVLRAVETIGGFALETISGFALEQL